MSRSRDWAWANRIKRESKARMSKQLTGISRLEKKGAATPTEPVFTVLGLRGRGHLYRFTLTSRRNYKTRTRQRAFGSEGPQRKFGAGNVFGHGIHSGNFQRQRTAERAFVTNGTGMRGTRRGLGHAAGRHY